MNKKDELIQLLAARRPADTWGAGNLIRNYTVIGSSSDSANKFSRRINISEGENLQQETFSD